MPGGEFQKCPTALKGLSHEILTVRLSAVAGRKKNLMSQNAATCREHVFTLRFSLYCCLTLILPKKFYFFVYSLSQQGFKKGSKR